MRARFLAICILFLLVLLPLSLYLYFTTKKIATLTIKTSPWITFSAQLVWSFGIDWLPLANKMLSYEQNCDTMCIFSPVLPAKYALTITASWKTTIFDDISINAWDQLVRSYSMNNDIIITPVGNINRNESLSQSLVENAISQNWWEFEMIGTDIRNRVWVIKKWIPTSQIWIINSEKFIPIRNIATTFFSGSIDETRSVLLLNLAGSKILLLAVDLSSEKEINTMSSVQIVSVIPGDIWKIQTNTGTLEFKWEKISDDIRFTNSIDLDSHIRIGYISKSDSLKLSLGNFPTTDSVLIQVDRLTGESVVLRRGFDLRSFFYYNGMAAYIDTAGNIYTIHK
jgi:hypothetical protein